MRKYSPGVAEDISCNSAIARNIEDGLKKDYENPPIRFKLKRKKFKESLNLKKN